MSDTIEIRVPDIGDFKDIPVIEVLVKPGDTIAKETPLVVLESDKASMEVPSSAAGVVQSVAVKPGDKVSEGSVIVTVAGAATPAPNAATEVSAQSGPSSSVILSVAPSGAESKERIEEIAVPDVGDFKDIPVIEVLVKPGDTIEKETPLVVLESDKASMEVPSPAAGVVKDVRVNVGDKVSQGSVILTVAVAGAAPEAPAAKQEPSSAPSTPAPSTSSGASAQDDTAAISVAPASSASLDTGTPVHASPSIRRFARELGVDIHGLKGSGPKGRITREDVQHYVKGALARAAEPGTTASPFGVPPWPKVKFEQYGEIERKPLTRIKKLSGPNLHRNWLAIPHITNQDEADITDLEAFRNEINAEQAKRKGPKFTILAFLVKACVAALEQFPEFNASLDGDDLIYKKYYNIGFAADTPGGLMVPVIKNADRKGLIEIARETSELAGKARDGKLPLGDMQGGTFTISSIGGIGGTAFTQIVNAPEVAILGAVRSTMKPVWNGKEFVPRLILPISVSYDHRVIDGAGAARFLAYVAGLLTDFRRVAL
ncbi:MAG TPA: dihydrolipoyllysine-residue acetyltransferase [Candidatus Acidoferrales bacterium]|nr:dihydrolipoyllysine-residue acetyltransferase [Candidatus Acidoferrales bacterium]